MDCSEVLSSEKSQDSAAGHLKCAYKRCPGILQGFFSFG
jgi:hypothetical protein